MKKYKVTGDYVHELSAHFKVYLSKLCFTQLVLIVYSKLPFIRKEQHLILSLNFLEAYERRLNLVARVGVLGRYSQFIFDLQHIDVIKLLQSMYLQY